jgi:hypothetical protein
MPKLDEVEEEQVTSALEDSMVELNAHAVVISQSNVHQ